MSVPPDNVYEQPPQPAFVISFSFQMVCLVSLNMPEKANQVVEKDISSLKD